MAGFVRIGPAHRRKEDEMHIRPGLPTRVPILALFLLTPGLVALLGAQSIPGGPQQAALEVISNPKIPVPPAGGRKRLVFKEELSIGLKEGDENYMFGSAIMFNTDETGNFYVTDWDRKKIVKYDQTGKYILMIGREGRGPGEFRNLSTARFDKAGEIYVTDIADRRISFFDRSGNFLRQVLLPGHFDDLYITARGDYVSGYTAILEGEAGMAFKAVDGIFNDRCELVTEFHSSVTERRLPAGRDAVSMAKFNAGVLSRTAFAPAPRHIQAADGTIFFGYSADYSIDVYSSEGRRMRTIKRAWDPVKINEADKADFATRTARPFIRQLSGIDSENDIRNILKYIDYPANKPAYEDFALMENGWLIVLMGSGNGKPSLFDLFDARGRYIGQFKAAFPAQRGLFFFKNGKAYAVTTDEEGYKSVKRYAMKIEDY